MIKTGIRLITGIQVPVNTLTEINPWLTRIHTEVTHFHWLFYKQSQRRQKPSVFHPCYQVRHTLSRLLTDTWTTVFNPAAWEDWSNVFAQPFIISAARASITMLGEWRRKAPLTLTASIDSLRHLLICNCLPSLFWYQQQWLGRWCGDRRRRRKSRKEGKRGLVIAHSKRPHEQPAL